MHRESDILIYHADGSGLIANAGKGLASGWSPDSKFIIAFLDESEDGHHISNSELYLVAADGSARWQLTMTKDVIEMWPSWHPVKNQIVFSDMKTGQLLLADVIIN